MTQTVGPYQVISELGRGSFGVVFLATKPPLERKFAVKVLLGASAEDIERFRMEAEIASKLNDRGVIPVLDIGSHAGHWYLAMPYCEGPTLATRLTREGTLDPKEAIEIVLSLATTLSSVHAQGVLHRDLKPSNVILSTEGPRIADFGLARDRALARSLTKTGDLLGTPRYMAPEQFEDAKRADARADVYSLGVILYRCLTGLPPYQSPDLVDLVAEILAGNPKPPRACDPAISRSLEAICLKAMHVDPDSRYATMNAFAADLGAFQRGELAPAASSRAGLAVSGSVALLVTAAAALWVARSNDESPPSVPAPPPVQALKPTGEPTPPLAPPTPPEPKPEPKEAPVAFEVLLQRGLMDWDMGERERAYAAIKEAALREPGRVMDRLRAGANRRPSQMLLIVLAQAFRAEIPDPSPDLKRRLAKRAEEAPPAARAKLLSALLNAARGRPWEELAPDLQSALDAAPQSIDVALARARLLVGRDIYDLARAEIRRARLLGVSSAVEFELARMEADLLWREGNLHDSPPAWLAVASKDPEGVEGLCARAQAEFLSGISGDRGPGYRRALGTVSEGLALSPRHERSRVMRVLLLSGLGQRLEAIALADEILADTGATDSQLLTFRAFALTPFQMGAGDLAAAQREFELALSVTRGCYHRIAASSVGFASPSGRAWQRELLLEGRRLEPDRAHVHEYLGLLNLHEGGPAEATLEHWRRARELEPRNEIQAPSVQLFRRRHGDSAELRRVLGTSARERPRGAE